MLRFVAILVAILIIVPLLRSVVGMILRGFADLLKSESTTPQKKQKPEAPVAGELKKDPVCGTYVSAATAFKKTAGTETLYFCSKECLQRHPA
jgi:YHS domain-containing protein